MGLNSKLSDIDLNDLDLENMGSWPLVVKVIFGCIVAALVSVLSYYVLIDSKIDQLNALKLKESELRTVYQTRYTLALNLEAYRAQMAEMEETFTFLLKQLPTTHETPGLLDDITYVGTSSGLTFLRINWEPEVEQDFYTELPIRIEVIGDYHQFGRFVSEVARLPRIVSLHDFTIQVERENRLRFNVVAKTYRYKDSK
jgi:type IV pilus assembly protein PilO